MISRLSVILLALFILNGANTQEEPKCAGCSCEELTIQPRWTKTIDRAWWDKQAADLQKAYGANYAVNVASISTLKGAQCSFKTACMLFGALGFEPVQMTILMGFYGKRPMYNVTLPIKQLELPDLDCSKDKTLSYHRHPFEFGGCIQLSRKVGRKV